MKLFNAFQIVILLAIFPYIIGWLKAEPFAYSAPLAWVCIVAYLIEFGMVIFCVHDTLDG